MNDDLQLVACVLAGILFALPTLAAACSCSRDERTLEQRVDDADRVLLVRVVGAELAGVRDNPGGPLIDRLSAGDTIEYRVSLIENFKGEATPLPSVFVDYEFSSCGIRMSVGQPALLYLRDGDTRVQFHYCDSGVDALNGWPIDLSPRLEAIRDFARDRQSIDACFNIVPLPEADKARCEAKQEAVRQARYRELRERHAD